MTQHRIRLVTGCRKSHDPSSDVLGVCCIGGAPLPLIADPFHVTPEELEGVRVASGVKLAGVGANGVKLGEVVALAMWESKDRG